MFGKFEGCLTKFFYSSELNFSNLPALFGSGKSQTWNVSVFCCLQKWPMHQARPRLYSVDLRLSPCRLQALSCNLAGATVGNWSPIGLYWTSFCGTYTTWVWIQNLPSSADQWVWTCWLDAAEEGSIAGDEQEFVKQELSCRNVVGKSGYCSRFHLYLEAFPYSLTCTTNFYLLLGHHPWIKRDFALLWIPLEKKYCDLEQFQSRCCFSTKKLFW